MSERRNVPPHRDCKREFQRNREFGRAAIHRAIVRVREQSPGWPSAISPMPLSAAGPATSQPSPETAPEATVPTNPAPRATSGANAPAQQEP